MGEKTLEKTFLKWKNHESTDREVLNDNHISAGTTIQVVVLNIFFKPLVGEMIQFD